MTYIIYSPIFLLHETGPLHPERKERLEVIEEAIVAKNLVPKERWKLPRKAKEEELFLCHDSEYVELVAKESKEVQEKNCLQMLSTGDVVLSPGSYEAALYAVGALVDAVDLVMQGKTKHVFCLVRPPGHHATRSRGMGFCIFNNIAIGARYVQKRYGVKRVLIIDWDVHHGNGTEDIFKDDPSVFYFSTCQEAIYPMKEREDAGVQVERGNFCYIPVMAQEDARENIVEAYEKVLVAKMEEFRPELVFISAGFDAHEGDPVGGLNLTNEDFQQLTKIACRIADKFAAGRVISALEGGYNLNDLGGSVVSHLEGLK